MFSKVLSLLAAALTLTAAPVNAQQLQPGPNSFEAHVQLVRAIRSVGVDVYFNPPMCKKETDKNRLSGFYASSHKALVICQDNAKNDSQLVEWTDNDLDTIRHEAQHLVQDCLDGIGDDSLVNMFEVSPTDGTMSLGEFVKASGLPSELILHIAESYSRQGATEHILNLEYEAWATAYGVDAIMIAEAVTNTCSAK